MSQTKGVAPVADKEINPEGSTRAVVIGISDYQPPSIPDLKFAHRDAKEFAMFLQSTAGYELAPNDIKLLINDEATNAQMVAALSWLIEESQEDDTAIIFFSGHGDVETKTLGQLGFLLTWDSPPQSYMAGAFPIFYLQEVIKTLSLVKKAKVLLVTDACRSGNLAGKQFEGAKLTNANLAEQFANEIKVLSCQPDEYSIEGEKWGGGRGVFSFYLTSGLFGNADKDGDGTVNLLEIGRYLEDEVTREALPHQQMPMTVGNRMERLSKVQQDLLATLEQSAVQLESQLSEMGEKQIIGSMEKETQIAYEAFQKALEEQRFFAPVQACAESFLQKVIADKKSLPLHATMKREYAASLQDEVQQAINALLESDPYEVNNLIHHPERYRHYPDYLLKSIDLLGQGHYSVPSILAKKYFFEAINLHRTLSASDKISKRERDSLHWIAINKINNAITLEPTGAYLYYEKSVFYTFHTPPATDSVVAYAQKALQISPRWVLPRLTVSEEFMYNVKNYKEAETWLLEAQRIDPDSYIILERLNWLYSILDQSDKAFVLVQKMMDLRPDLYNSYANMGGYYFSIRNYVEAEKWYLKSLAIDDSPSNFIHLFLGYLYFITGREELAKHYYSELINNDQTAFWMKNYLRVWNGKALVNFTVQYQEAINILDEALKTLQVKLDIVEANVWKAKALILKDELNKVEKLLLDVIKIDPTVHPNILAYSLLGEIKNKEKELTEAEKWFKKGVEFSTGIYLHDMYFREEALYRYGNFLLSQNRLQEAEKYFRKSLEYVHEKGYFGFYGLAKLSAKKGENNLALDYLEKSLINHFPNKNDIENEPLFAGIKKSEKYSSLVQKYYSNK